MTILLIIAFLVLVTGTAWVISRRSASKRLREEEAQEDARLGREAQEEVAAMQARREQYNLETARQAARPSVPRMPLRSELDVRRRARTERDREDGLADADLARAYEPTLTDDLLSGHDWRSLPDSYRELPDPPKHDPAPSSPSEDTGRWTPSFEDTGRHAPPDSNDSPPSYSGD